MSGFNNKKAVDDLYESGKPEQDETDNQQFAQGQEEVSNISNMIYYTVINHHLCHQYCVVSSGTS